MFLGRFRADALDEIPPPQANHQHQRQYHTAEQDGEGELHNVAADV